ncbi:MAG TPA: tyrosinase family protein [Solirubrobacteraceae bacterium]|nr:tyrosinase family protein [Solirubrobacteraceae bacterium]
MSELQDAYEGGDKKPLETVMRAWKGIKELDPSDPRSFFMLGGYHGEPFRGAGWGSSAYWGGYCNHGNVLFPLWHRVYLYEIENALRSIPGCADVTLPFWDECSEDSLTQGVPWAFTNETFELDGATIPNPLRSYVFQRSIADNISGDDPNYSKPAGYETVRYPYSGLVGTPEDQKKTAEHNKRWTYPQAVQVLNKNVVAWLNQKIVIKGQTRGTGIHQEFLDCLEAPNYTVFSNTSSMAEWNANGPHVVALESPHNHVHLAVGGCDVPNYDASVIPDANGDMGENDTAGLDPIFFFHHCFIDRVFWLWQTKHGFTDDLPIMPHYPGTNSVDNQGPTPGVPPNSWLSMDSPLEPFVKSDDGQKRFYVGRDAFNIETQLGYRYGDGSLVEQAAAPPAAAAADGPKVHVTGVDRGRIRGSFLIAAYVEDEGEKKLIGSHSVLSRWHVQGCANCQTHLRAAASFPLHGLDPEELGDDAVHVEVRTHDGLLGGRRHGLKALVGSEEERPYRVEVR